MKRFSIFFLLGLISVSCLSQDVLPVFGKGDIKELLLKKCPFENEANAMKLLDMQETEITIANSEFHLKVERRVRIKIFNKDGMDVANVIIPYMRKNKKSKVNDISAYIFNLDSIGKNIITQKLQKDQIFKEKTVNGISTIAFTFPDVKPGSVIEYRYTYIEKNSFHFDPWFFQDKLPTAISICKFIYPLGVQFDYRFITTDSVSKEYDIIRGSNMWIFTLKNIYAFRDEPMMSSVKDNLQRVEFSLLPPASSFDVSWIRESRWSAYNRLLRLAPFLGHQIHTLIPETDTILDSVKKISSNDDKIHFIYNKVKSALKWDQTLSFYAVDLNEVWKTKSANSAEINLSILNLLKKAGIKAYPILISTRGNGKTDPDFTSLGQFNSVDVLVLDSAHYYILDGTQKYISYKIPPYNIINRDVFLIDSLNYKWINISDDRPLMRTNISVNAELNKAGELKGGSYISYYDHSKASEMEKGDRTESESEEFIQKESSDLLIDSLIESNQDNELLPLTRSFNFTYKLPVTGDYYILDPFFLSRFRKNPFIDSLRRTDIDMGSNQSYTMYFYLTISDDYLIDDLPQSLLIRSSDSSMLFKREVIQQDNVLVFRNSFNIQRTIYDKEEYVGVKEFFKKMYNIINDRIVFKKKT